MTTTKKLSNGNIKITKTYSFVGRDPVIDVMETVMHNSGKNPNQLSKIGGPSPSVMYNMRNGKTKSPHFKSIVRTARATGGDVVIMTKDGNTIKLPRNVGKGA